MTPRHEPQAEALLARIEGACRVSAAALVVESALVGLATALLTAAVVRIDSASELVSVSAPAALTGVLSAFTWWLECTQDRRSLVQRIDVRGGSAGALFTAWELATRARSSFGVGALLIERQLSAVSAPVLWRRAFRVRIALLALVCASAAVCAWAFESAPAGEVDSRAREAVAVAADKVVRSARSQAGPHRPGLPPSSVVAESARALVQPEASHPAESLDPDRLRALAREASTLALDPRTSAGEGAALQRLASALEVLRGATPRPESARSGGASLGAGPRPGRSGSATAVPGDGGASASQGDPPRAPATAPASMDGRVHAPEVRVAEGSGPGFEALEPRSDGAWWAPRYDAVVSRWIEVRRTHP